MKIYGNFLNLTDGWFDKLKIKVKSAKLWNRDFVGMAILPYCCFFDNKLVNLGY